jgi:hypothetical protein
MEAGKWTAEDVRAALAEWQEASPVRISFSVDELSGLVLNLNLIEKHTRTIGVLRSRTAPAESAAIMDVADRLNSLMTTLVSAGQRVRQEREQEQNVKGLQRVLIGVLVVVLLALIPFMMSGSGAAAAPVLAAGVLIQQAEATVEPTSAAPELTPVPTVEPVVTPVEQIEATGQLLTQVLLFIGSLAGGSAILMAFGSFLADRRTRQATEKLYLSQPPEAQERLANLADRVADIADEAIKTLGGISDFLRDVTDGKLDAQRVETRSGALSDEMRGALLKLAKLDGKTYQLNPDDAANAPRAQWKAGPAPLSDGPAD